MVSAETWEETIGQVLGDGGSFCFLHDARTEDSTVSDDEVGGKLRVIRHARQVVCVV